MSSLIQWRQFSFFEQSAVDSAGQSDTHLAALWRTIDITAHSFARGQLVLADASGFVHIVDKSLLASSFPAYSMLITHLLMFKQRNLCVTIGFDDDDSHPPLLKCWDLDRIGEDKSPLCVRSIPVQQSADEVNGVTQIAVCETSMNLAVGLSNGVVLLFKGDLARDRYLRQRVVFPPGSSGGQEGPVTGLGWLTDQTSTTLFVTTGESVLGYRINATSEVLEFRTLGGCKSGCSGTTVGGDFVVARPEALFLFAPDGRGPCLVLDDVKTSVSVFKNYVAVIGKGSKSDSDTDGVIIYDLKNKFISFSAFYPANVLLVVYAWGQPYVFTADKMIFRLKERDTTQKLETLYSKNLFSVAVKVAINSNLDESSVTNIYRRFGDYLYQKGDFDAAIEQYQLTIGKLQPSYVILKFLDTQRIHNLTSFLQCLHERNFASPDHTTLLLNCYAKMHDSQRLSDFIHRDDVFFDVDTAIMVCRSAKYHESAAYLAGKFKRHEIFIEIQLEDLENYAEAMSYIAKLKFVDAESTMKQYGKVLVSMAPEESTTLLINLCTGSYKSQAEESESDTSPKSHPEDFIHNFVNQKRWLMHFLETYIARVPNCDRKAVWNTLFELYLSPNDASSEASDPEVLLQLENKAISLLKNRNACYNVDQALILCQLHQFLPGILYLYEKSERYHDIVQFHMDNLEYLQVISACRKFGELNPDLWAQVLTFFSERPEDCRSEINEVLKEISARSLLSPLQVVEILSKNPLITLDLVKDFILQRLDNELDIIRKDETLIETYQKETAVLEAEIAELDSNCVVFQVSKCTTCSTMLDLPAVHFLCKHSYHLRCLGENERQCPKCLPDHRKTRESYKACEDSKNNHDDFFGELAKSPTPFAVVSKYFARNVFTKSDETPTIQ